MNAAEIDWAASKRRQGFSWQAVARMLGCCESDLRRHCEPPKAKSRPKPVTIKVAAPAKPIRHYPLTGRGKEMMALLYAAEAPVKRRGLPGSKPADTILRLRTKFGYDAIESAIWRGYWLTEKGRRLYELEIGLVGEMPPLNDRIVRVIVRMGGSRLDAMHHTGLGSRAIAEIAKRLGLRFGGSCKGLPLERMRVAA